MIRYSVDGYNRLPLTQADVASVVLTLWDRDGVTKLVDQEPMLYDASLTFADGTVRPGWYYVWTTPTTAGSYTGRVTVTGVQINHDHFLTVRTRQPRAV